MKKMFVLLMSVLLFGSLHAQENEIPDYLVAQNFPDSVLNQPMFSLAGEEVSFSSVLAAHKGKKIVIDLWAAWCKDCISGLPKVVKLRKRTEADKVDYVFISIDEDESKWKTAIDKFGVTGDHYRIDYNGYIPLLTYVSLTSIPRYLVLDENSQIIVPAAASEDNFGSENLLLGTR